MNILLLLIFFYFGSMIGSFLNVLILRLPKKENFSTTRSYCPKCKTQLCWYHNIPIFSYMFLKGKCAFCKTSISKQYVLVETITGLISVVVFHQTLLKGFSGINLARYSFSFSILCTFLVILVIDFRHKIIPNLLNIYLALIFALSKLMTHDWVNMILGAALGFLLPFSVTYIFFKWKGKVGLGGGDIKLYSVLGIVFGPIGIIHNIFASCFIGSILGLILIGTGRIKKGEPIAFGPFIVIAATIQLFFPASFNNIIKLFIPF